MDAKHKVPFPWFGTGFEIPLHKNKTGLGADQLSEFHRQEYHLIGVKSPRDCYKFWTDDARSCCSK